MKQRAWSDKTGLDVSSQTRQRAVRGLKAVADWAVRNQVRHCWPKWNANTGRFPYHVYLPTNDTFLSTSWNTARTCQGLFSAWQVLGNKEYLDAAELGLEYVKSLQVFTPENPEAHGAFIEETPLGDHVAQRDGVECAQAFLAQYMATGNKTALLRTRAFLDWQMKEFKSDKWPGGLLMLADPLNRAGGDDAMIFIFAAGAIPLCQYVALTGERKEYVTKCAAPMIDYVLEEIQKSDGSYRWAKPHRDHHAPLPNDPTVYNDDGIGIATLCAWKATKQKKYLDSVVAYADWWRDRDPEKLPHTFAMLTCMSIFMCDMARATGDQRYLDFIGKVEDRLFGLQILRDERYLVSGGFRGEDMAHVYRPGSNAFDWISLRSCSYGLMAMAKLAAANAKQWGPSYSAFGW